MLDYTLIGLMIQRIKNPTFGLDYMHKYSAGVELLGNEVKSIRAGQCSLRGSSCVVRGGEMFLLGVDIPPYQKANTSKDYDPFRARRLLLNKKEIRELAGYDARSDLVIIPLEVYNKGRAIKVTIAVAKKLKKHDKREKIKERESDRSIRRLFKG